MSIDPETKTFDFVPPLTPASSGLPAMTLRDWFAGQALAGTLSSSTIFPKTPTDWHNEYSRDAYRVADAMLAAREGGSNAD